MERLLEATLVLCHPFVIGELARGTLRQRAKILGALHLMPAAPVATQREALGFLENRHLSSRGIGWVDVHLLASTLLVGGAQLWTRDKRLGAVAMDLGINYTDRIRRA